MILTGDRVVTNNEKMDEVTSSHQNEQKSSYPKRSSVVELWRKREGAIRSAANTTNIIPSPSAKSYILSAEEVEEKLSIDNIKFEEENIECNHHQHQHQHQLIGSPQHSEQDSRLYNEKIASNSNNLRYDDDDNAGNSRKIVASDSERNEPESPAVATETNDNNNTDGSGNVDLGKKQVVVVSTPPARRSNIRDSWKKRAVNSTPPLPSPPQHPSTPNRKAMSINTPCSPVILYNDQSTDSPSNCSSPVLLDDIDRQQSLDASLNSSPIVVESTTTTTTTTTSPSGKRSGIRNSSWRNRGGSIGSINSTTSTTNSVTKSIIDEHHTTADGTSNVVNETPPSNNSINNNATSSPSSSAFDELKSKWAKFGVTQYQPPHPTSTKSLPSQVTNTSSTPIKSFSRTVPPPSDGNYVITNQLTETTQKEQEEEEEEVDIKSPSKINFRPKIPDSSSVNKPIKNELVVVTGEGSSPSSNISSAENNKSKFSPKFGGGHTSNISRVDNLRKINTSSSSPEKRIQKNSIGSDSKVTTKSSPSSSSSSSPLASKAIAMGSSRLASRRKLDSKGLRSKYTRRQNSATTSSTTSNTDEQSLDMTKKNSSATNSSADDFIPVKQSIAATTSFVSAEQSINHSSLPSSAEQELVPSFPLDESIQDDSTNLYNAATIPTKVIERSEELNTKDRVSHSFVPIQSQYETVNRLSTETNGGVMTKSTLVSPKSNSTDALNSFIAVSKFKSNSSSTYPKTQNNQQQNPNNNNKVDRASFDDSWSSSASNSRGEGSGEVRNQNYSNSNSRSSLNSRASRKLRDIRQRQQQARNSRNEVQDKINDESSKELNTEVLTNESQQKNNDVSSPELTMKASVPHDEVNHSLDDNVLQPQPLLESPSQTPQIIDSRPSVPTPIIRRTKTNESCASSLISMDESTALSPSLCSETTYDNSQMHITTESATIAGETRDSQATRDSSQRSRLIVSDADRMVPDEFVSEKNANVESFKTAYESTSFGQIAKDMTEQASSVLGIDILNSGMQNTLNKLVLGDVFGQKKITRKKVPKRRVPSPVEEVAIEVEYVADSD
jgi:hypothetical protein